MVNRIDICNRALTNIGMEPIESEEAQGAETVLNAYDSELDLLLSAYPWSFARMLRQLSHVEIPPRAHWRYAFKLPADRVGQPTGIYASKEQAGRDEPLKLFEYRDDNGLLCDEPIIWIKYVGRPNPARWPGIFRKCVQLAIEVELAIAVREDKGLRDRKRQELFGSPSQGMDGGLFAEAKNVDAQSTVSQMLESESGDLIDARFM